MSESLRQQALYTWLRVKQVGPLAGDVSPFTVRAWIDAGELRALNIGTKLRPEYRIRQEWLDDFLARRMNA